MILTQDTKNDAKYCDVYLSVIIHELLVTTNIILLGNVFCSLHENTWLLIFSWRDSKKAYQSSIRLARLRASMNQPS